MSQVLTLRSTRLSDERFFRVGESSLTPLSPGRRSPSSSVTNFLFHIYMSLSHYIEILPGRPDESRAPPLRK